MSSHNRHVHDRPGGNRNVCRSRSGAGKRWLRVLRVASRWAIAARPGARRARARPAASFARSAPSWRARRTSHRPSFRGSRTTPTSNSASNRKEGRPMHPIAALMLSRTIEEERRRVMSPRRRWLNDVQDARAERRASLDRRHPSPRHPAALRLHGVAAAARAPGPMRSGRSLPRPMARASHGCRGSTPGASPGLSSAGDATDPHRHPRRGPHG